MKDNMMKKILLIIILQFFCISHLYANDNYLDEFNEWLSKNGHYDYVINAKVPDICKQEKRYSHLWYYNKCDEIKLENNLNIKFYKSSEIPWGANPNKDTLLYYLFTYLETENGYDRAGSKGSKNHYKFSTELRVDKISKYIKKHMQKTALLSYLLLRIIKLQ